MPVSVHISIYHLLITWAPYYGTRKPYNKNTVLSTSHTFRFFFCRVDTFYITLQIKNLTLGKFLEAIQIVDYGGSRIQTSVYLIPNPMYALILYLTSLLLSRHPCSFPVS